MQKHSLSAAWVTTLACFALSSLALAYCPQATAIRPAEHFYNDDQAAPAGTVIHVLNSGSSEHLIDPMATEWSRATSTEVSLYPQDLLSPRGGGSTSLLTVKAVRTSDVLILRLDWNDTTCDDSTSSSTFKDGAAVQFPVGDPRSKNLAMGHSANPVNIWHWQADASARELNVQIPRSLRNADSKKQRSKRHQVMPGSSFQELVASGIYTQQMKPNQLQKLEGRATWRDGRWYLTILRPLGAKGDGPNFDGDSIPVAFAIWNGSAGERLGMKSVSNWTVLSLR